MRNVRTAERTERLVQLWRTAITGPGIRDFTVSPAVPFAEELPVDARDLH
jgi:hypothetical protein